MRPTAIYRRLPGSRRSIIRGWRSWRWSTTRAAATTSAPWSPARYSRRWRANRCAIWASPASRRCAPNQARRRTRRPRPACRRASGRRSNDPPNAHRRRETPEIGAPRLRRPKLASMHEIGEAARSIGMILATLIADLAGARVLGDRGVAVRAVRNDSRAIEPGDVFVAVRGLRSDGHAFVAAAIERGAAAVVVEREVDSRVPQAIVESGAEALGVMVGHALGDPARAMTLVGITGTNGKTTTTYLVEAALIAAGHRPGVIGTVTYRWGGPGGTSVDAPYSTPTPQILHEALAKMRDAGCTHVVMETTSAALDMRRLAGLAFAVGAFSNLTQDHLDVHGTMEAYRDAKRLLFTRHLAGGTAVVNVDDP